MMGALLVLLGFGLGITVHGYYSMKYVVTDEFLILKWSFFKKEIPLQEIVSISSVSKEKLQGIRSFGIGIPGHFVGRFQLRLDGEFRPTTLYATKLDNLLIFHTVEKKTYGITPDNPEEFINAIQSKGENVTKIEIDYSQPIRATEEIVKKAQNSITLFFLICDALTIGTYIYFIIAYQGLPETGVPLHWGIGGVVDRWGERSELLIMVSIFTGIELLISALVYIWMRTSDFGKVKIGKLIMLFPLIITLVFSVLVIVIVQATLNYF